MGEHAAPQWTQAERYEKVLRKEITLNAAIEDLDKEWCAAGQVAVGGTKIHRAPSSTHALIAENRTLEPIPEGQGMTS